MSFGLEPTPETVVNIKVVGVGGAVNNVVNRCNNSRHNRLHSAALLRRFSKNLLMKENMEAKFYKYVLFL